ncbi:MAG TPA: branched-chain amino acid ABC transporter substrate-binding protein [Gaiellaceae bacterium]
MSRRVTFAAVIGVAAPLAAVAAFASGASSATKAAGAVSPLPSSSCGPLIYKGSGSPDYIVASDLPLQGAGRAQTIEMTKAIQWALESRKYQAGQYKIGYQSCDDSTAQTGGWDSAKCATNARLYANNRSVIGVVGTFNSGCAKIIVPVLGRASNGPLAMVSPANTAVGLTHGGPAAEAGEPNKYYPTGKRNYARVVAADDIQGPADAIWTKSLGVKKVYVLNDKQTYGFGVASTYRTAAKKIGLQVVGFKGWDAKQSSYEALGNAIKASGAQAVFLGGIICNNGQKLMKDIKSVYPSVKLVMPDGFSDPKSNGTVADGSWISVAGQPPSKLKGAGAQFVKSFGKQIHATPNPYSAYGAQAMLVMLDSIAKSGGQRANVAKSLFGLKVTNSILGTFTINSNGDTNLTPITIYKQGNGKLTPVKTIVPNV